MEQLNQTFPTQSPSILVVILYSLKAAHFPIMKASLSDINYADLDIFSMNTDNPIIRYYSKEAQLIAKMVLYK
jgi:hypothetical protein